MAAFLCAWRFDGYVVKSKNADKWEEFGYNSEIKFFKLHGVVEKRRNIKELAKTVVLAVLTNPFWGLPRQNPIL